jgi:hypothetical protein
MNADLETKHDADSTVLSVRMYETVPDTCCRSTYLPLLPVRTYVRPYVYVLSVRTGTCLLWFEARQSTVDE